MSDYSLSSELQLNCLYLLGFSGPLKDDEDDEIGSNQPANEQPPSNAETSPADDEPKPFVPPSTIGFTPIPANFDGKNSNNK